MKDHSLPIIFPVYVIAPNLLAGKYLVQILAQENGPQPVLCLSMPRGLSRETPAVFVMDNSFLLLPLGECLRQLNSQFPEARHIVVDRVERGHEIVRLLKMGVHGFVLHSDVASVLRRAVCAVAEGDFWIPRKIMRTYVESTARRDQDRRNSMEMTLREIHVLELVERHLSNKEIAGILGVQESTVKYHISNILGKLQVGSRQDLAPAAQSVTLWRQFQA